MSWIWVLSFGVIGVTSRFAIDSWIAKFTLSFPFGTLAINICGCFIAGLCLGPDPQRSLADAPLRLGIIVGFCGGFTTFSGFGLQFMQMATNGRFSSAIVYAICSPILCILAVAGGLLSARFIS